MLALQRNGYKGYDRMSPTIVKNVVQERTPVVGFTALRDLDNQNVRVQCVKCGTVKMLTMATWVNAEVAMAQLCHQCKKK